MRLANAPNSVLSPIRALLSAYYGDDNRSADNISDTYDLGGRPRGVRVELRWQRQYSPHRAELRRRLGDAAAVTAFRSNTGARWEARVVAEVPVLIRWYLILAICIIAGVYPEAIALAAPEAHPLNTTVCELVLHPDQYDEKRLAVRVSVQSDGLDVLGGIDPSCARSGIAISISPTVSRQHEAHELLDAVFPNGTLEQNITATVVGTFEWRPGRVPHRVIRASDIIDLRIKPIKARIR
jgi:hypothetical protein